MKQAEGVEEILLLSIQYLLRVVVTLPHVQTSSMCYFPVGHSRRKKIRNESELRALFRRRTKIRHRVTRELLTNSPRRTDNQCTDLVSSESSIPSDKTLEDRDDKR